jgi:Leucine-rich repeat (LRR) protein
LLTLNLASNRLSGFPLEITQLVNLAVLNLSGNGHGGQIPPLLGEMTGLRELDLSRNGLTGPIPSQVGSLVNLRALFLNDNQLNGPVPAELANANMVSSIRIDKNDISGELPPEICDLYDQTQPISYADCAELVNADCFTFCCADDRPKCVCRFQFTDPLRCVV